MSEKDENQITIKDVIDFVSRQGELFGSASAAEAADIKKAWYNNMFTALENLKNKVDAINTELLNDRANFYRELVNVKDELKKEISSFKNNHHSDMKDFDDRMDRLSESSKMDLADYKHNQLEKERDLKGELNNLITPIKERISAIEVKVSLWGLLAGAVGSGVIEIVIWVVKTFILGEGSTP